MTSEAQKRAIAKWQNENMKVLSCKVKKDKAEELRVYAENQGLTINKFATLAINYCYMKLHRKSCNTTKCL